MIKNFVIFIVIFASSFVFAQPGKVDVETVNGKKYYVHFIKEGQTLYGLHQTYNVPVGDIVRANNNLTGGLQIGQKILIPISLNNKAYYSSHTVQKGETLYGISKRYKCSVIDLKNLNPELNETAIKIGQNIKVPVNTKVKNPNNNPINSAEQIITDPIKHNIGDTIKTVYNDSIITHKVLKHETLYSISKRYMVTIQSIKALNTIKNNKVKAGDLLKIKVKNVSYQIVENEIDKPVNIDIDTTLNLNQYVKKDKYKIALFLPLMLSKNESYMNKPMRVGEIRELYPTTKVSSGFYHGFMLAADSLSKAGLNVEIYVYDTKKDTNIIKNNFKKVSLHQIQ